MGLLGTGRGPLDQRLCVNLLKSQSDGFKETQNDHREICFLSGCLAPMKEGCMSQVVYLGLIYYTDKQCNIIYVQFMHIRTRALHIFYSFYKFFKTVPQ